jgi:hypothetical protein
MAEDTRPRTIDVLIDRIAANPDILDKVKTQPIETLTDIGRQIKTQYPPTTATNDKFTYRLAVVVLSAAILSVVGIIGWQWQSVGAGKLEIPEVLISIGSTALGALAGLLMPGGGGGK